MYEFLKALFGTTAEGQPEALTFEQLSAKLEAAKDLKLVNLADGGYVSTEKFKAEEAKAKGLETQLGEANTQIESFKSMDIEAIKKSAEDWKEKHRVDTEALNAQIAQINRDHQKELLFSGIQFHDDFAKAGVMAAFEKQEFKLDKEGKFVGAKEWLEGLRNDEKTKAAFASQAPADPPADPKPAEPAGKPKPKFADPKPKSAEPKPRPSLTELMKQKNQNPDAEINYD